MEDKPLINRLMDVYEKQKYTYFVTDGQGNTMAEGLDELSARMFALKDSSYSIGRDEEHVRVLNDDGIEISYANKDELNAEDFK